MSERPAKSRPTWSDVKAKLDGFDRKGLLGLVRDLYDAHKDNQRFLHTRFGLGGDVLEPYRQIIERWISPDVVRDQRPSVAKAKQAISDYKKAGGDPASLVELMVFYCELAADFCTSYGEDDAPYLNTLVNMFEDALLVARTLPSESRDAFRLRLAKVRDVCNNMGYGVGDAMEDMLAECP